MPSSNSSSGSWVDASLYPDARAFVNYLTASPTPYHAIHEAKAILDKAGFKLLSERDSWKSKVKPGCKYYVTRNNTSLVAFALPSNFKPSRGFSIVGTHTDSCRFIIRPTSKSETEGYARVKVEAYGGGNWHTWLDRDLGIAGVVNTRSNGKESHHLVLIDRPLMRIPTIAIHLDREQNEKMSYNKETGMVPILSLLSSQLNKSTASTSNKHSSVLLDLLKDHLSLASVQDITGFDLSLFDTHAPCLGGAHSEFIYGPRLDNLFSSYCATEGLARSAKSDALSGETGHMIALWDHEECGSQSVAGAMSNFLESTIGRITGCTKEGDSDEEAVHRCIANSYLISADMAHAVHPSFPEKHEVNLRPKMNEGPTVKINSNQRYATSNETMTLLQRIALKAAVPLQYFETRNDMPCGSTIGPMSSTIGIRTIDIGCAQLSMHSIRETAGSQDVAHLINLLQGFHQLYGTTDSELSLTQA